MVTDTLAGYSVGLKDTRDYYQHDIRFIIAVTLLVVLLTLMVLLRAIVAPLYLVASVVVSYLSAVGVGAVVFQFILGQQLHWSVPPLAFVVLVAVGADYNMLLATRMRDESPHSMRYGIIRTLSSTGGVITAAGLIFAAGHLPGADHHGSGRRCAGRAGKLVAVTRRPASVGSRPRPASSELGATPGCV